MQRFVTFAKNQKKRQNNNSSNVCKIWKWYFNVYRFPIRRDRALQNTPTKKKKMKTTSMNSDDRIQWTHIETSNNTVLTLRTYTCNHTAPHTTIFWLYISMAGLFTCDRKRQQWSWESYSNIGHWTENGFRSTHIALLLIVLVAFILIRCIARMSLVYELL